MLSDWVGGICGRLGDAAIFSLHKILPVPFGGMLAVAAGQAALLDRLVDTPDAAPVPWIYDLCEIAACRRRNAARLAQLLQPLADDIQPLWGLPCAGEVPQTFPVL